MKNILITGATGNIGCEVIRFLYKIETQHRIIAGVRNIEKAKHHFKDFPKLEYSHFDFEDSATYDSATKNIDIIFLLRPPHISDIETFFKPLIATIKSNNIQKIVFLSVQGAEKSNIIPHNKIERLINEFDLEYIFLRPSYFMQNITTTLLSDIQTRRKIILPAGKAKFNWIDIENIGEVGAIVLNDFEKFKNQAIEITGLENENFAHVTALINKNIESPIRYRNVNPFKFIWIKKKDGMEMGMIIVMLLLHFLPRFQGEPKISHFYEQLTGKKPTDIESFIKRERVKIEK